MWIRQCPTISSQRLRQLAVFLVAGLGATAVHAQGAQWPVAGHDARNTRYQSDESEIGRENASRLIVKWVFQTHGDVSATPTVANGALFVPDWGGYLYKIDAKSGQAIWSHKIAEYDGLDTVSRTSPALTGNEIIIGDREQAHVMAIDQSTGDLLWITQVAVHPDAIITGSPVVAHGVIYVGVSSTEDGAPGPWTFRGSVLALDAASGQILWKTYMVPEGYSGGPVWSSTPVVDDKRGLLYVTTGNNYSVPANVGACVDNCLPPEDHIDSIVALDLATGAIRWGMRTVTSDTWTFKNPQGPDADFGAGANLFATTLQGKPQDLVGAGQKNGIYWAVDPDTGRVAWQTQVGPSSPLGGILWGTATDGKRIYAAVSNYSKKPWTLVPSNIQANGGFWSALDPATGRLLWQTADPTGDSDFGPVTVANGVVFAGSMDPQGHVYALDAASGHILWSFASGGSVVAGAAVVDGVVYWGSGYSRIGVGNNQLYAFALPPPAPGDVNGDGRVSVGDAVLALRMAVALLAPTADQLQAADLNGDGVVDVADATRILRLAVGLGGA